MSEKNVIILVSLQRTEFSGKDFSYIFIEVNVVMEMTGEYQPLPLIMKHNC